MKLINKITASIIIILSITHVYGDNPIISGMGVCDPHIRIFDNKAYLYASHDTGPGYPDFQMEDWWVWSSPNLVDWQLEFTLKPENTYIGAPLSKCFAPDGIERNGNYYLYFSEFNEQTGVAVSTNGPAGPYICKGSPLLPSDLTPIHDYDCSIFVDDDPGRTPYIIWGYGTHYYIARLKENMIELDEAPRVVDFGKAWNQDAPALHKHNGVYYLNTHGSFYATASNVYGPYKYRGRFFKGWNDHGSVFNWNNQNFFTYGVQDGGTYYRKTKITYVNFKENGDIAVDEFIADASLGVGQ